MSRGEDTLRLRDMLDAAQAAIRLLGDLTAEWIENAETLALAVPHAVEIVGEDASRVSRPFREAHPEIDLERRDGHAPPHRPRLLRRRRPAPVVKVRESSTKVHHRSPARRQPPSALLGARRTEAQAPLPSRG